MNDANGILKALGARGILKVTEDAVACKAKIAQLGLTAPDGTSNCMFVGRQGEDAIYVFARYRNVRRDGAGWRYLGFKFDLARYLGDPLAPDIGTRYAAYRLAHFAAEQVGFDIKTFNWSITGCSQN